MTLLRPKYLMHKFAKSCLHDTPHRPRLKAIQHSFYIIIQLASYVHAYTISNTRHHLNFYCLSWHQNYKKPILTSFLKSVICYNNKGDDLQSYGLLQITLKLEYKISKVLVYIFVRYGATRKTT